MTYAEWQYERGEDTVRCFSGWRKLEGEGGLASMFKGKDILDVGCGAAGKSVYYASLGAKSVVGIDIREGLRAEAEALAAAKGVEGRFRYVKADSAGTGFEAASFDTAIMNDAMEHVGDPEGTLDECLRLLRPGGRLYINFPPYGHPYGAHLSDAIRIPWVHLFCSEQSMAAAYSTLVAGLPDGRARVGMRFETGPDGKMHNTYINKMSIARFRRILEARLPGAVHVFQNPRRTGQDAGRSTQDAAGRAGQDAAGRTGQGAGLSTQSAAGRTGGQDPGRAGQTQAPSSAPATQASGARLAYYEELPLRGFLAMPARMPLLKEALVRMVVAVIET